MGAWGFYCDENDDALDTWDELVSRLLSEDPRREPPGSDDDASYEEQQDWVEKNFHLVADMVSELMPGNTAMFMLVARHGVPSGLLNMLAGGSSPRRVFSHPELARKVKPVLEAMIRKLDGHPERSGYSNGNKRLDALRDELKIAEAMIAAGGEKAYKVLEVPRGEDTAGH